MKNIIQLISFLIIFALTLFIPTNSFATDSILITISDNMDNVIFDGKWTDRAEWKNSSVNNLSYDNMEIQLRTAHQDEFIFILIDVIGDHNLAKGSDKAIICFDTENNKTQKPGIDDYCFMSVLGKEIPFTFQGNSSFAINGYFQKIINHKQLIGTSSISDENDRYSKTPHATYEFKIPIDIIGRSQIYGFYLSVYDSYTNKHFSWPENSISNNLLYVPSTNQWGEIISPDKSLPEFELSFILIVPALLVVIYLTNSKVFKTFSL
jgi:hypothetical protein